MNFYEKTRESRHNPRLWMPRSLRSGMRYSRHDADSMQTRLEHPNAFGNPDWRDMSVVQRCRGEIINFPCSSLCHTPRSRDCYGTCLWSRKSFDQHLACLILSQKISQKMSTPMARLRWAQDNERHNSRLRDDLSDNQLEWRRCLFYPVSGYFCPDSDQQGITDYSF